MAINLNEKVVTAKTVYDGEEHFNQVVPDGKSWIVTVYLKIEESTV